MAFPIPGSHTPGVPHARELTRAESRALRGTGACCCSCGSTTASEVEAEHVRLANLESPLRPQHRPYARRQDAPEAAVATPVHVNVYHLVPVARNHMLKKCGVGVFHTGVQVFEQEYSFGAPASSSEQTGVFCVPPMQACGDLHCHLFLGHTYITKEQFRTLVRRITVEWAASTYHVLGRNCNHFCHELLDLLSPRGKEPMRLPQWINRVSQIADTVIPRPLATWVMYRSNGLKPPKAGGGRSVANVGTDVRTAARAMCRTDPIAMQFQIMALMRRTSSAPPHTPTAGAPATGGHEPPVLQQHRRRKSSSAAPRHDEEGHPVVSSPITMKQSPRELSPSGSQLPADENVVTPAAVELPPVDASSSSCVASTSFTSTASPPKPGVSSMHRSIRGRATLTAPLPPGSTTRRASTKPEAATSSHAGREPPTSGAMLAASSGTTSGAMLATSSAATTAGAASGAGTFSLSEPPRPGGPRRLAYAVPASASTPSSALLPNDSTILSDRHAASHADPLNLDVSMTSGLGSPARAETRRVRIEPAQCSMGLSDSELVTPRHAADPDTPTPNRRPQRNFLDTCSTTPPRPAPSCEDVSAQALQSDVGSSEDCRNHHESDSNDAQQLHVAVPPSPNGSPKRRIRCPAVVSSSRQDMESPDGDTVADYHSRMPALCGAGASDSAFLYAQSPTNVEGAVAAGPPPLQQCCPSGGRPTGSPPASQSLRRNTDVTEDDLTFTYTQHQTSAAHVVHTDGGLLDDPSELEAHTAALLLSDAGGPSVLDTGTTGAATAGLTGNNAFREASESDEDIGELDLEGREEDDDAGALVDPRLRVGRGAAGAASEHRALPPHTTTATQRPTETRPPSPPTTSRSSSSSRSAVHPSLS